MENDGRGGKQRTDVVPKKVAVNESASIRTNTHSKITNKLPTVISLTCGRSHHRREDGRHGTAGVASAHPAAAAVGSRRPPGRGRPRPRCTAARQATPPAGHGD